LNYDLASFPKRLSQVIKKSIVKNKQTTVSWFLYIAKRFVVSKGARLGGVFLPFLFILRKKNILTF
jgi:hypothetical protein